MDLSCCYPFCSMILMVPAFAYHLTLQVSNARIALTIVAQVTNVRLCVSMVMVIAYVIGLPFRMLILHTVYHIQGTVEYRFGIEIPRDYVLIIHSQA